MKATIRETKPASRDDQTAAKEYGVFRDATQVGTLALRGFKWTLTSMAGDILHETGVLNDGKSVAVLTFSQG